MSRFSDIAGAAMDRNLVHQDVLGIVGHVGDLAYYETVCSGLIPVKVLGLFAGEERDYAPGLRADVKVTATRPGYPRNGKFSVPVNHLIPRNALMTVRGSYGRKRLVLPYRWTAQ